MNILPIVILAGGLATRLHPVTKTIPKSLLEINNEPFINHQLRLLQARGIKKIILCVGFLGELIQEHVGDGSAFNLEVQYSFDGLSLLGTGGSIKNALPLIDSENFFVLYGDSYLNCDYSAVQTAFLKKESLGQMTVFHNQGKWDTSNIEYTNGKLICYDKVNLNKHMHYIDYGLGILSKQAFDFFSDESVFDLAQVYQLLLSKKSLAAYEIKQRFYEVGTFAGIKELEYYLSQSNYT